jgi:signal transduction histidine kinase/ActR/RegA family two-component response regulator
MLAYLGVHDKVTGPFDAEDCAMLESLAAHAAVALENSRRIEDQRREQAALRHTQKLESLGLLAGGIAHDFNNLLSAILGNLGLATREAAPDSSLGKCLQNIDRAVMRAANLTRQMLAYAGMGRFQIKRMELNHTVAEMAGLLEASLPKKIRLELRLGERLPDLEADSAQIEQVILNLVTNASDAIGDQDGTIRLTTGFQSLDVDYMHGLFPGSELAPGPYLTLEVLDDGGGMPVEVQDRIFDPFFSTKGLGRGLGLSAMLGILKTHKGGIKIYSEPGKGSTFRIFLPAILEVQDHPEIASASQALEGRGTVLVVDDDPDVRAATCGQMEALGFQVLEAGDGLEAVATYRTQGKNIRLVLMDLSMPRMDGVEALRAIRSLDPKARVILCSGFDEGTIRRGQDGERPDAFLQKPYRHEELRSALRETLEGRG